MKLSALLICLAIFAYIGLLFLPQTQSVINSVNFSNKANSPTPYPFSESKLWDFIQDWRTSQGLKPYKTDPRLCEFTETRLSEIQTNFSHKGFDDRIKTSSFPLQYKDLGENLAKDHGTEQKFLTAWLDSPKHRENLNRNYEYSCLRCTPFIKNFMCVQLFANF